MSLSPCRPWKLTGIILACLTAHVPSLTSTLVLQFQSYFSEHSILSEFWIPESLLMCCSSFLQTPTSPQKSTVLWGWRIESCHAVGGFQKYWMPRSLLVHSCWGGKCSMTSLKIQWKCYQLSCSQSALTVIRVDFFFILTVLFVA